jgi:hypothetical protein
LVFRQDLQDGLDKACGKISGAQVNAKAFVFTYPVYPVHPVKVFSLCRGVCVFVMVAVVIGAIGAQFYQRVPRSGPM